MLVAYMMSATSAYRQYCSTLTHSNREQFWGWCYTIPSLLPQPTRFFQVRWGPCLYNPILVAAIPYSPLTQLVPCCNTPQHPPSHQEQFSESGRGNSLPVYFQGLVLCPVAPYCCPPSAIQQNNEINLVQPTSVFRKLVSWLLSASARILDTVANIFKY